jgi:hypothetical protein
MTRENGVRLAIALAIGACLVATLGAQSVELKEIKNAAKGYSLKIPAKAEVLSDDSFGVTYSQLLGGGEELLVSISYGYISPETLDEAVADATMIGSQEIIEKRAVPGSGFEVVKREMLSQVEIWYFAQIGENAIKLKCAGPMRYKDFLLQIARSLKASK